MVRRESWSVLWLLLGLAIALGTLTAAASRTVKTSEERFQEHQLVLASRAAEAVASEIARARRLAQAIQPEGLPADPALRSVWLAGHQELYDVFSVHAVRVRGPLGDVLAHLGASLPAPLTEGIKVCEDCRISDRQLGLVGTSDGAGKVDRGRSLPVLAQRAPALAGPIGGRGPCLDDRPRTAGRRQPGHGAHREPALHGR